jgi:glycosyltransferase involved in cell wall biosynthesis
MKISVVTVTFNQINFIGHCIESVRQLKNIFDVEHIIVDGLSVDGTVEYLKRLKDDHIKVFYGPDFGPADALRKGLSNATGEILCFLNSDDYFLPGAAELLCDVFSRNPINGSRMYMFGGFKKISTKFGYMLPTIITPKRVQSKSSKIFQQGVFFEKSLYLKSAGVNVNNRTCWDRELFYSLYVNGAAPIRSFRPVAVFVIHEDSISGSGRLSRINAEEGDLIDKKFVNEFSRNCGNRYVNNIFFRLYDRFFSMIYGFLFKRLISNA